MDKRVLRSNRTRRKLLKAAKTVFLTHGYHETTIKMINEEANTGHGTIYAHFPSGKDEVLSFILEEVMDEFYKVADITFNPQTTDEAYDIIRNQLHAFISLADKHKNTLAVFYESIGVSILLREKWENILFAFEDRINKDIAYSQKKKLAKLDLDHDIVAKVLLATGEHFLWEIVTKRNTKSIDDIADNVAKVYMFGLYHSSYET